MAAEIKLKLSNTEASRLMWLLSRRYGMIGDNRATLNSLVTKALAEIVRDEAQKTLQQVN